LVVARDGKRRGTMKVQQGPIVFQTGRKTQYNHGRRFKRMGEVPKKRQKFTGFS